MMVMTDDAELESVLIIYYILRLGTGFPNNSVGKESTCNAGRPRLDSWVGKIPWRRDRLLTPVFWPREFHGLCSHGVAESDMTEQLSLSRLGTHPCFIPRQTYFSALFKII